MITKSKLIVVKVGTDAITNLDGSVNTDAINALVGQISDIKKAGHAVILVSSGAMGFARGLIDHAKVASEVGKRQVLSSIGQVLLMETYRAAFAKHDLLCAQILATKDDFRSRSHYLNIRQCFENLVNNNVVAIVNENDAVSLTELMFTDNDELAGLVASMMDANMLFILTTVKGVYTDDANDAVLREILPGDSTWKQHIKNEKSEFGRGGMMTKCTVGAQMAVLGIQTVIMAVSDFGLSDIQRGGMHGTTFRPAKKTSTIKKWIAHSKEHANGVVYINEGARGTLIQKEKVASLLPIGIVKIEGDFEAGDIVEIRDDRDIRIGFGKVQYGSDIAREYIGKHDKKPFIHYDYLYLE